MAELAWFKNATARSSRVDELYAILADAHAARTSAEWLAIFERLDIPHSPVRTPRRPAVRSASGRCRLLRRRTLRLDTPVKRTLRQAVNVEDVAAAPDLPPPPLGADTAAVLSEAGCSEAEIAQALPPAKRR